MSYQLRYDDQVAVVTGAGNGLGRQYALFLASRGAKVVVNDLGVAFNGKDSGRRGDARVADVVVKEIQQAGGTAVANYDPVQKGDRIIQTAIDTYGRIDILINNAGILRDITLRNMKQEDWDLIMDVHLHGAYKTTRAAWPFMQKQRHGRIVNTSSASGLYGNFGQSNYATAKMALVGFSKTLAKEGSAYNITCNILAPSAASRMTQTVWTQDLLDVMKPDWVVPLVGVLVHNQCRENGSIFAAAAGHYSKIRWERSKGLFTNPEGLTPSVILDNWEKIADSTHGAEHPTEPASMLQVREKTKTLPKLASPGDKKVSFESKVVLVSGGGVGLGRACSRLFAALGAKVVVVDDAKNADTVANEIKSSGGTALAVAMPIEEAAAIVQKVLETYGRIDVVVNSSGILEDHAFSDMTDEHWYRVVNSNLRSTYLITRAVFPVMLKQKYGRIVNIASPSGIYGKVGGASLAAAKAGTIGFTKTVAREGAKYNIIANTVAPAEESSDLITSDSVAPVVASLCGEKPLVSGKLFESGGGWIGATRWQRARGFDFDPNKGVPSVEEFAEVFSEICDFENGKADNPDTPQEGSKYTMGNAMKNPKIAAGMAQENPANRKYIARIQKAMTQTPTSKTYTYGDRDVILYNISMGAHRTDLDLVYEKSPNFQALPTFGIVPTYGASLNISELVPNYDYRMLLHGEQYLEIKQHPIPTSGTLKTETRLLEVVDKGNAALVRRGSSISDASGKPIFYTESVVHIRGSGGFGGQKKFSDRGASTAANTPPARSPDKVVEERTSDDLAALYRLLGDRNPLHIDPEVSAKGGFPVPILHGLATFGISGKHVVQAYGPFKNIKVRFSGSVLPGQTIVTEMWKEGGRVVYRAKVKETGKSCISNAAAELLEGAPKL